MSYPSPLGPTQTIGQVGSHPSLRLWPDAANAALKTAHQPEIYYYLPLHPRLVRDGNGRPVLALTLVLDRQPTPQDDTIAPLIRQGIVNFEITFAPVAITEDTTTITYRPLFTRAVDFELISDRPDSTVTLATATANSSPARAALSATLNREDTLALLSTLDGTDTPLKLHSRVTYRAAATEQILRLSGAWIAVYDFLKPRVAAAGTLSAMDLSQYFAQMLQERVLKVGAIDEKGKEELVAKPDATLLFNRLLKLATVVLKRESLELETDDAQNRYVLRGRPHPMFHLDYQQTYANAGQAALALTTDLSQILGGALDGLDRSLFIHLVAPSTHSGIPTPDMPNHGTANSAGGLTAVPSRLRTDSRQSRQSSFRSSVKLAEIAGTVKSIPLALQPSATAMLKPMVLEASSAIQVQGGATSGRVKQWWMDNMVVGRPNIATMKSGPVIHDPNAALWNDILDTSWSWYAPAFVLVSPAATDNPEISPFLFSFGRTGTTQTGQPALIGQVRITLQTQMGDRTQAALKAKGNPVAYPVQQLNLAVILSVPFIDSNDGKLKRNLFTGVVQQSGSKVVAKFELLNDWVRLCYGALASPGFQREAVQVLVSYTYMGYVPFQMAEVEMVYGGKLARTPVVYSPEEARQMRQQPYLDAINLTYQLPQASIQLRQEALYSVAQMSEAQSQERLNTGSTLDSPALSASIQSGAMLSSGSVGAVLNRPVSPNLLNRPIDEGMVRIKPKPVQPIPIVARPTIESSIELQKILVRAQYAQRSLTRQESVDVLFPCQQFGALYREQTAEISVAIGCRDAFQLGQTAYRQYEKIEELSHVAYTVYRSLQQPGRFLVVPTHYRITRYESTEGSKAYRPCIMVYLQIDANVAANNRVVFQSMLQPDLSPTIRRDLQDKLLRYARDPVLEYPTEIVSNISYTWAAIDQVVPSAVLAPNGLLVVLDTDLLHAQLVQNMLQRSGFYGSVRFELPDGVTVQSNLSLELSNITGPWSGPLDVALTWSGPFSTAMVGGNKVSLTNKIERAISVSDLLLYTSTVRADNPVPVETILSPGASASFNLGSSCDLVMPVYSVAPGTATLEEVRSYVEDIHTNVAFLDLVNYDNHNLQRLEITAQLAGVVGTYAVSTNVTSRTVTVDLVLPLTVYLANRILQFQVTKILNTGEPITTPWLTWDLTLQGNLISLTWEAIQ